MTIGILTFHNSINFGAVLQAYALKETVQSIYADVEILDYRTPYISNRYKIISIDTRSMRRLIKSIIFTLTRFPRRCVNFAFSRFRKKYMNLSKKAKTSSEICKKDVYIVGSDQVWNSTITHFDKTFFLDFASDHQKKIAYAASIGEDKLNKAQEIFIRENIQNIDYVSVREDSAVDILKNLTDKKVYQALDPTLLADPVIWDKLISTRNRYGNNYLLVYKVLKNQELFKTARMVAEKLHLKIVYINNYESAQQGFINARRIDPRKFLTLFKGASFVVTNSFHGTAFSIIFNKDFISVANNRRGNRLQSILNQLQLDSRLILKSTEIDTQYSFEIDYTLPNELLKKEKEKSLASLIQSIEGKA